MCLELEGSYKNFEGGESPVTGTCCYSALGSCYLLAQQSVEQSLQETVLSQLQDWKPDCGQTQPIKPVQ